MDKIGVGILAALGAVAGSLIGAVVGAEIGAASRLPGHPGEGDLHKTARRLGREAKFAGRGALIGVPVGAFVAGALAANADPPKGSAPVGAGAAIRARI